MTEPEEKEVQRAQDTAERERKARREATREKEDPRGEQESPQPFSGPSR